MKIFRLRGLHKKIRVITCMEEELEIICLAIESFVDNDLSEEAVESITQVINQKDTLESQLISVMSVLNNKIYNYDKLDKFSFKLETKIVKNVVDNNENL